jgi:peptidoglycan/LPS O-acetylase OafA/YrhL
VRRLGYVPALDGIRGIAIALVVAGHFFGIPPGGLVGVDLFFVLSGFLITTLILDELDARGRLSIRRFYERRARRLLPALFVMLAVYVIVLAARGHDGLNTAALGGLYIGNIVQAFNLAPIRHSALLHLWSLAEEEQFYLVWPLLLVVLVRARRAFTWLVTLLALLIVYRIALVASNPSWLRVYYSPDTHSDGLVFGAVLAMLRVRKGAFAVPEWAGQVGVAALTLGAFFGSLSVKWMAFGLPAFELGLVFLLAAAVSGTALARCLASRPLVGLGKVSYSLYLWHAPVWFAVADTLHLSNLPTGLVSLPLALACAAASYHWVEQPFRRRRASAPLLQPT